MQNYISITIRANYNIRNWYVSIDWAIDKQQADIFTKPNAVTEPATIFLENIIKLGLMYCNKPKIGMPTMCMVCTCNSGLNYRWIFEERLLGCTVKWTRDALKDVSVLYFPTKLRFPEIKELIIFYCDFAELTALSICILIHVYR